jgi:hypothetical protein
MSNVPYEQCSECNHHIDPQYGCGCAAEPKPTPSTRRIIADPNPTFPGKFGLRVEDSELSADWGFADAEYEADLKPQPDSSSISSEQTFEQWWATDPVWTTPSSLARAAWNTAKGQR